VVAYGPDGAPPADWVAGLVGVRNAANVVSGQSIQAGTSTTSIAPTVTPPEADSLVISVLSEATGTAGTFSITSGSTQFFSSGEGDGVIQFIVMGSTTHGPTPTSAVVATAQQTQAANGQGVQVVIPPRADPQPEGALAYNGLGQPVRVFIKTASGVETPSLIPVRRGFSNVAEMMATDGFTWAHRGLTTFAEESLYAYTRAVILGHGALEVSLFRTSDGHWGAAHDNNPSRITGGAYTANWSTYTRAQVEAMSITIGGGAPRPLMWWNEIRDTYGSTHVLILDPKNFNWGAYQTEFLGMCDQLGPGRVIVKQYASDVSLASAAAARGYTTWGHTFNDFMADPALQTYIAAWDMLGTEISSSQGDWNILIASGKPVIGHIAASQADYDQAMLKGAVGVQTTSATVKPVSWWT
jgi:hypothetical protein